MEPDSTQSDEPAATEGADDDPDETGSESPSEGTADDSADTPGSSQEASDAGAEPNTGGTSDMGEAPQTGETSDVGGTEEQDPTQVETCQAPLPLETGRNYGDYSLYAIRLVPDIEPGTYVLKASPGADGSLSLSRDDTQIGEFQYDVDASLEDNATQTIVIEGYFELDIRSTAAADLSGLPDAMFDGCHALVVDAASVIEEGGEYGRFVIATLTIDEQAPSGTYTFYTDSGNTGSVVMRRDGEVVDTLEYAWSTTVGDGESYVFDFLGVVSFEVTRGMGTSNLFGLAEVLFDGRAELQVP
jgi:hypothetical protein